MKYLYGELTDTQVLEAARIMHNDIHKLLIYKDSKIVDKNFKSESEYFKFFNNLLLKFDGINTLLDHPKLMLYFMGTLQRAYEEAQKEDFDYRLYKKLIFDAHGYLSQMFGEVR